MIRLTLDVTKYDPSIYSTIFPPKKSTNERLDQYVKTAIKIKYPNPTGHQKDSNTIWPIQIIKSNRSLVSHEKHLTNYNQINGAM